MKDTIRIDDGGRVIVNEKCSYRKTELNRRSMNDVIREFNFFLQQLEDYAQQKDLDPILKGSMVVKALSFREWLEQDMDDIMEQARKYKDSNSKDNQKSAQLKPVQVFLFPTEINKIY